ncbi:hypothetical protein [Hydrogenibacillus schlegelii]|nr:hypothetical protein [Hydrogenibacillus schlegelii]
MEKMLTVREREVLDLVLEGLSDEAIGQKGTAPLDLDTLFGLPM